MFSKDFYIAAVHLFALAVLICICVFVCDVYLDTLVVTKQGWIRGFRASDGNYVKYMGIPYARVSKENPFGESIPFPKLKGVFQANNNKIICPQVDMLSLQYVGTLNCLHLNVYVPHNKVSKPVMVFIHGGRFALGFTGTFQATHFHGPRYFMKHDVILVTISYRLGPYGFFCLDSPEVPGNQGINDIIKALMWVKENIHAFGGDTNKITVFGHSAGSMITDLLLYTKAEKYIDQAILQSGTAHAADVLWNVNNSVPLIISKHLGLETNDLEEALSFLKSRSTQDVVVAAKNLSIEFRPCIEKRFENYDGLINKDPFNTKPSVKNKKIILGHTTEEYNMKFQKPIQYFKENDVFDSMLEYEFDFNNEKGKEAVSSVRHFYIGDNEVNEDLKWKIVNFTSDITFNYPVYRDMDKFIQNGAEKVYYYIFAYTSSSNLYKKLLNISVGRSIHGDELAYLFETNTIPPLSASDIIIMERMTTMWTNFAKYGNPTPNKSEMLPVQWLPISKYSRNYLLIDLDEEMGKDLYKDRIDFWDTFYKTYKQFTRPNKTFVNLLL
ncbi:juvenile hormone esterase-like [Pieris rapae]|uniref:juvenile hormone esterase-like n=1 Tax=Pieris rapae TaxID=64459 RepID=UPI001E280196|nr:juvenile hormone esterase-like [Pieris rapae]